MRPLLSICIPTFRRGNIVYNTVLDHLSFKNDEIEVVVSDNGSPDNTIELLSSIEDTRLKLYSNDQNRGFCYNLYNVIRNAKGYFVCLMSDEDILDHSKLSLILQWIRSFAEDGVDVGIIAPIHAPNIITKQEELNRILYGRCSYISGIILNRDKIKQENLVPNIYHAYPHIELALFCASQGRVIFAGFDYVINKYNDESMAERLKLEPKKNNIVVQSPYDPISRLKQFREENSMILALEVSEKIKYSLLKRQYIVKLFQSTLVYELIMRSDKMVNSLGLDRDKEYPDIDINISNYFLQLVEDNFTERYSIRAKNEVVHKLDYINHVRKTRREIDELFEDNQYVSVVVGKGEYVIDATNKLLEHNFRVNLISMTHNDSRLNDSINIEEINKISKVVLIIDSNDSELYEHIQSMDFEEAHLFYMQDLHIVY